VRFRPGLHAAVLGSIFVVAVLAAAYLAQRGSLEVAIHLDRDGSPLAYSWSALRMELQKTRTDGGTYEIREGRLFGGENERGPVRNWSRPIVLEDCRIGFASSAGALESGLTRGKCADLPATPSLRAEQARAAEELEAFRQDTSASSVDVVYGSRRGGLREALATLAIGAILLVTALLWRSAVRIDPARGELVIDERRFPAARRRVVLPLADITGVCVETSRRWGLFHRVSLLSRAGRAPITAGYSVGQKRHIALRLRLEAALAR
jgi:hypothetical protein